MIIIDPKKKSPTVVKDASMDDMDDFKMVGEQMWDALQGGSKESFLDALDALKAYLEEVDEKQDEALR